VEREQQIFDRVGVRQQLVQILIIHIDVCSEQVCVKFGFIMRRLSWCRMLWEMWALNMGGKHTSGELALIGESWVSV
jgi:hypothetical protein